MLHRSAAALRSQQIGILRKTGVVDSQPTNAYSESSGAKPAGGKMLSSQVTAQAKANNGTAAATAATTAAVTAPATTTSAPVAVNSGSFKWGWPAEGKVISNYTGPTSGNRVLISVVRGQPVLLQRRVKWCIPVMRYAATVIWSSS